MEIPNESHEEFIKALADYEINKLENDGTLDQWRDEHKSNNSIPWVEFLSIKLRELYKNS